MTDCSTAYDGVADGQSQCFFAADALINFGNNAVETIWPKPSDSGNTYPDNETGSINTTWMMESRQY